MWDQAGQLYAYHRDVPAEVRLLKLTEEVGEVAEAFIGTSRTPSTTKSGAGRPSPKAS
jgi:NTP pyrophosphatase (non-canonical NTP hydrolase)